MTIEVNGTIKEVSRHVYVKMGVISGKIYGDTKGRYADGDSMHTSPVLKLYPGDIAQTENSYYKIEWLGGDAPEIYP